MIANLCVYSLDSSLRTSHPSRNPNYDGDFSASDFELSTFVSFSHPRDSRIFKPVNSCTLSTVLAATFSVCFRPSCVASLTRCQVIAPCAFAISCFSASVAKYLSSRLPRYEDRLCVVWGRKCRAEAIKKTGGNKNRMGSIRFRAMIEPERVATPT